MSLYAERKQYAQPPEGMWPAVCVDVVDLGLEASPWGDLHKIRIVWELACKMEDGRPFTAGAKYTLSLGEKANLYKILKSWRGNKDFTADELRKFDVENVIGKSCQLVITHTEKEGNIYGNVTAVLKPDPKNALKPSGKYTRVINREGSQPPRTKATPGDAYEKPATRGPDDPHPDPTIDW